MVSQARPSAAVGALAAFLFLLSWAVVLVSAILAYGDRRAVAGADGPGVRAVGKGDACGAQLVDQACCLAWGGDLHGAVRQRLIVAVEEDGQGGQVRQDLVLTDVGVLRSAGFRTGGAARWHLGRRYSRPR